MPVPKKGPNGCKPPFQSRPKLDELSQLSNDELTALVLEGHKAFSNGKVVSDD